MAFKRVILNLILLITAAVSLSAFADRTANSSSGFLLDDPPPPPSLVTPTAKNTAPSVVLRPNTTRPPGISEPVPLPLPVPKPIPPPVTAPNGSSKFEKTCKGAICKPFYNAFKNCEPECEPTNYGAHRDSPGSCHSQSRAFDLMGMACKVDGKSKNFTAFTPRYFKMVACIKAKHKKTVPYIIWQTTDHYDHAHFGVGCYIDGGLRW